MTLAELERVFESRNRVRENERKDKAYFDYKLADLIGCSVARVFNKNNKMPTIYQAYPNFFVEPHQDKEALFALQFKLFAQSNNRKYGGEQSE